MNWHRYITIQHCRNWRGIDWLNQGQWVGLHLGPILIIRTPWRVR